MSPTTMRRFVVAADNSSAMSPTPPRPMISRGPLHPVDNAFFRALKAVRPPHMRLPAMRESSSASIDQIAWVWHQHVAGEAAVEVDTQIPGVTAQLLITLFTVRAAPAADPWIHRE